MSDFPQRGRLPRLPAALIVAAALAAGPAFGQVAKPAARPAAEPLQRSAFLATMDGEYRKLDANRDGVVTKAELETHQRNLAQAAAAERARTLFAKIDSDRNGQLSLGEFQRAHGAGAGKPDVTEVLARLDGNRDQKVTLVEYRTLTLAKFDSLDADKDGALSAAEQRAGGFVR